MRAGIVLATFVFAMLLVSCGGGGGSPPPPVTEPSLIPVVDHFLADGTLRLAGVDPHAFNPVSAQVRFEMVDGEFLQDADEIHLSVGGVPVPGGSLVIAATVVSATGILQDGRNDLSFQACDIDGRPLFLTATVWAGSSPLDVTVLDETGALLTSAAGVDVTLGDDATVTAHVDTSTGHAIFANLPGRTIIVHATASANRSGSVGAFGTDGAVTVRLIGFAPPSLVDNNDLGQGTAGWNAGTSPVSVQGHVEGAPLYAAVEPAGTGGGGDNDLVLGTSGEGEQAVSRTFTTDVDTTGIRVRYRFITSEVPGGYFGTEYNDYFRVSIRSLTAGGSVQEANTMNGLGLAAFDFASGATAWRELTLPLDAGGDTVQVDAVVANVGDALYDSQVVIDFVEEEKQDVRPVLAWNSTTGGLDLTWQVVGQALTSNVTLNVFWARGPQYADRLGAAILSHVVPSGTPVGPSPAPVHIAGNLLLTEEVGTTHLIAESSNGKSVFALADVQIGFGANADAAVVSAESLRIVRGLLRFAGQSSATISSTARTPEDQARAMFNNLTNPANTLAQNIATQHGIYAAPGDAVIDVFAAQTAGMTTAQAVAAQAAIRQAMVNEINTQGPSSVSRHCADSAVTNVLDIGAGAFTATSAALFAGEAPAHVDNFIDERTTNSCFHLEIAQ